MMGTGRFDQDTFSMGGGKKKTGLYRVPVIVGRRPRRNRNLFERCRARSSSFLTVSRARTRAIITSHNARPFLFSGRDADLLSHSTSFVTSTAAFACALFLCSCNFLHDGRRAFLASQKGAAQT